MKSLLWALLPLLALSSALPGVPPVSAAGAADQPRSATVAGLPVEEALRLGERMYREGLLPSGEPLKAIVKEDIPLEGSQFTCATCHQRSGFGSMEGTIRTAPIHGTQLYAPLSKFKGIPIRGRRAGSDEALYRPAYTDESLALALRTGQDSSGRQMNSLMPIYSLDGRDMAILVYYLKHLSTGTEPGVTDTSLRFATVIAGDVPQEDRDAMVNILRRFMASWRITPGMERMMRAEAYVQEGTPQSVRKLELVVWELKGPAETWRRQLDDWYRREPVFALLAGMASESWEPMHRFCEDNRIPSLFPLTDYPVLNGNGGYTLYLSKGLAEEGEAAARYVHSREDLPADAVVVQVFRSDRAGRLLSQSFRKEWTELGHAAPRAVMLQPGEQAKPSLWKRVNARPEKTIAVLWLSEADAPALDSLFSSPTPAMIVGSSSLLGAGMNAIAERLRPALYLTYPYSLPQERRAAVAGRNGSQLGKPSVETRMQPLFTILRGPLARIRSYVYRDYLMELLEGSTDLTGDLMPYLRLSFGAGQRYASKGCYMVQLGPGPSPGLIKRTGWVIP